MKKIIYYLIIFSAPLFYSCQSSEEIEPTSILDNHSIEVIIGNSKEMDTRVIRDEYDDWSTAGFSTGDAIGFFTRSGIKNTPNGRAINVRMDYMGRSSSTGYRFGNSDIELPQYLASYSSYLYYPYTSIFDNEADFESTEGLKLRQIDNGIEKCIDFLYSPMAYADNNTNQVLVSLQHRFSEIILFRGKGFDQAENTDINIIVTEPYTDIRVQGTRIDVETGLTNEWKEKLYYNGENTQEERLRHRTWKAWQASKWKYDIESWYAIIPTTGTNKLSYIELYDNDGLLHKITDFQSWNKVFKEGYRHIMTVELTDYGVQVRPVIIQNWDDTIDITDKREKGINNYVDYEEWALAYNAYNLNRSNPDDNYVSILEKYGDRIETNNGASQLWTFYITGDINLKEDTKYQVDYLNDKIEGGSYYNFFKISNIKKTLFGEITADGSFSYMKLDNVFIQNLIEEQPIGVIANKLKGGYLNNIIINNGTLVGNEAVGMIVGDINGGSVTNTTVSGSIFGKHTYSVAGEPNFGLFGEVSGNPELVNNNSKALIFESNN